MSEIESLGIVLKDSALCLKRVEFSNFDWRLRI